jgi:hypothetical protein
MIGLVLWLVRGLVPLVATLLMTEGVPVLVLPVLVVLVRVLVVPLRRAWMMMVIMLPAKSLLFAAFGAAAWNAQSALLQSRLSFAGAPAAKSPAGAGSAGISDVARLEIHTQAALQNTSFNDT